ncbi:hypothetical protein D3C79_1071360 [compost metagenome]
MLAILIDGIDQAAFCFTVNSNFVAVAVNVGGELAAAKGDFVIAVGIVQRQKVNI